jgi:hypothetical protein
MDSGNSDVEMSVFNNPSYAVLLLQYFLCTLQCSR